MKNRMQKRRDAEIFVKHIESHLVNMPLSNPKVICKICGKTLDEIVKEETNKGIWLADGIYIEDIEYIDRNGKKFMVKEIS